MDIKELYDLNILLKSLEKTFRYNERIKDQIGCILFHNEHLIKQEIDKLYNACKNIKVKVVKG